MKKEVIEKLSILITSAFGLVAALAWNGAIQAIFKKVLGTTEGIISMIIYALTVSVIAVVVAIWAGKISEKLK